MKKLLAIVVLWLVWNVNANSEIIRLKCITKYQDTRHPDDLNSKDPIYYNIDTNKTDTIITDNHISHYAANALTPDTKFLSYEVINRYDGSLLFKSVTVPNDVFNNFFRLNNKYNEKETKELKRTVDKFFYKNKTSKDGIYLEEKGECTSLKKKF